MFIPIDPEDAALVKRPLLMIRVVCAPVLVNLERCRNLKELIWRSAGTGLLLCGGGMMLAIAVDLPPGPLIGTLCVALLIAFQVKKEN